MKARILVVDDEEDIIKTLSARLNQYGFEVDAVTDGESALAGIKENPPDLIILDIMMPGMDGTQVAAKLKENKVTAGIPIIFLSALLTKEDEEDGGNQLGNDIVFAKPYDIEELVSKIKELIS